MRDMKRVILLATVFVALSATRSASATEVGTRRPFGLGVQVFEPTSIIGKYFLDRDNALDFGVGFWDYGHCYDSNGNRYVCNDSYQAFSVHFDYLYEEPIVDSTVRLDWHVGAGGRMVFGDHAYWYNNEQHSAALFARVPVGLDLAFRRPQWLEVYLEIAPGLWIFPPLHFDIDVGLGVRAYF
jgi:hypothetical protein